MNLALTPNQVLRRICAKRLLPAVGVYQPQAAVNVARALLAGGLDVMEITFRKPGAAECITAIRSAEPAMLVGAGTLLTPTQLESAVRAGAQFGVTPGFNPNIVTAARECGLPLFPGIATPGELEQALALGIAAAKVFPAEQLGGAAYLQALNGPYVHTGIKLIPMGGVTPANATAYCRVPIVGAVGGSWLVTEKHLATADWAAITGLTVQALALTAQAKSN